MKKMQEKRGVDVDSTNAVCSQTAGDCRKYPTGEG